MRVCITLEERFRRTPDGSVWSGASGTCGYSFWQRYLTAFDRVKVIARVADVQAPEPHWIRADGEAVVFHALPYYIGPVQYARRYFSVIRSIRGSVAGDDAVIMRVPSVIAHRLERQLARSRPFALEVVGDPYEVLAPGSVNHPLRPFFRTQMTSQLQRQCRTAAAIAYVSGETLQRRYPPNPMAFCTAYSSIELRDAAFAPVPRVITTRPCPLRIVSVGSLALPYKGFDTLIDAAAACVHAGLDVDVTIVGDGRCRTDLERRTQACGMERRIAFRGQLPAEAVRHELSRADLFVLASKTEGLPRAMIEAMASGLPCIGSAVGAIPELLDSESLFERGNAPALARKVAEIVNDPARMTRMSARNLRVAREYHSSVLTERRREFYTYVREATRHWNKGSAADLRQPETPAAPASFSTDL